MKCQILFPGKNKKNISKCCLLKILPRVLSFKQKLDLSWQTFLVTELELLEVIIMNINIQTPESLTILVLKFLSGLHRVQALIEQQSDPHRN